jgi:hypothetical protein
MLEGLRPDNAKPIAAIVSLPQTNIEISGKMCSGIFSENDYADYSGYWFGFNNSFRGQDFAGLHFGTVTVTNVDPLTGLNVINPHSHVILLQTTSPQMLSGRPVVVHLGYGYVNDLRLS